MAEQRTKITTISKLRVGQEFTWIPKAWYGPSVLLGKTRHKYYDSEGRPIYTLDLKYDCACVNPPGLTYGVRDNTEVTVYVKR